MMLTTGGDPPISEVEKLLKGGDRVYWRSY